tara:strand:+ start:4706 stop:4960 length:255 start_codon:yes stop_codon:yes gene_type:complete
MSIFQWVMIGLAAVLAVPVLFNRLDDWLNSRTPEKPKPEGGDSLVDVIDCWERLKELCEKHNLDEAKQEVHKVFPLFAKSKDVL